MRRVGFLQVFSLWIRFCGYLIRCCLGFVKRFIQSVDVNAYHCYVYLLNSLFYMNIICFVVLLNRCCVCFK